MKALLLAAGYGSRLRPLTTYLPKCLVPIHGRPLLDYWLESLSRKGVDQILVNTHYLAPLVRKFLEQGRWASKISMVHESSLLGTGGTILRNRAFLDGAPFLVAHADNLTIFDVGAFQARHLRRPEGTCMTMMLFEAPDPSSCGIVELDGRAVVTAFHEKTQSPPGDLANAAVYILEPSVIDHLESLNKKEIDLSTEVIPHMMGRIFTFRNESYHRDIGTIESWVQANKDFPVMPMMTENAISWDHVLRSAGQDVSRLLSDLLA